MIMPVIVLAIIGLIISIYGVMVERKLQQNEQYKAACDISDMISCTRPMLSPYGKMFGISNIWMSVLYYCAILALCFLQCTTLLLFLSLAGVAVSVVFAYILYVKIKSLCLICTALYAINIALAVVCYFS